MYYAKGFKNRFLQHLARFMPGETTFQIWCHRMRGIKMGKDVCLGYDLILETQYPEWIWMGNNVEINMRSTLVANFEDIDIQPKGPGLRRYRSSSKTTSSSVPASSYFPTSSSGAERR